ncbi:MAG: 2OG-Fe(II) oxygenase [Cyclobacteriaceae bacterium]|nr:2OG-Fe(II) oxygenase [Cyclobacteriaceae bacterium]
MTLADLNQKIADLDFSIATDQLHEKGFTLLPGILTAEQCSHLIDEYDNPEIYRKKIVMERYRFGLGEYKYFTYPLPDLIQTIREIIFQKLVPIANAWMKCLNIDIVYPETHQEFLALCHQQMQTKPTVLILKYGKGGHNTLHQDLYGEVYFPMQLVLFLNEPGLDYTGGEFVLTQQIPRAQSKAIVLTPKKGDILIFTTNFKPVKGTKGYYRINMKHGVSEIHRGERHTLGIIFHDALN